GLAYANGPLSVDGMYHVIQNPAAGADDQTEWYLSAGYNLGFATVMASYQEAEDIIGKTGGFQNMEAWQVGGVIPVGAAGNVHIAYGQMEYDTASGGEVDTWGIAYTHGLSKRTTAYVGYNSVGNDANTSAGFGDVAGEDADLFVVGVRHAF
ncbi:MAG: porin, partial [Rhodocyclaceae bacterium]|nr:porin [Rhodocyclaceae bacterium]